MQITKLYISPFAPSDYVVEIDGNPSDLRLLPTSIAHASQNLARMRPFRGSAHHLEGVPGYCVMTLKWSGYPVSEEYFEAAMAENAKAAAE